MSFKNIKLLTVVYHCHVITYISIYLCLYALLHVYCFSDTVPETVPAISLSIMENVILIQDQDFEFTCSAININNEFVVSWSIPSESVRSTHLLNNLRLLPLSTVPNLN